MTLSHVHEDGMHKRHFALLRRLYSNRSSGGKKPPQLLTPVGTRVGALVGCFDGAVEGPSEGTRVGRVEGKAVGPSVLPPKSHREEDKSRKQTDVSAR
jgi:hypothetical protein